MAERIGVEVSLTGADAVIAKLRQIDALGNKIDGKKWTAKIGTAQAKVAEGIRKSTAAITRQGKAYNVVAGKTAKVVDGVERVTKRLRETDAFRANATAAKGYVRSAQLAMTNLDRQINSNNRSLEQQRQAYKQASADVVRFGALMMGSPNQNSWINELTDAMKRKREARAAMGTLRDENRVLQNRKRELGTELRAQKDIAKALSDQTREMSRQERITQREAAARRKAEWNERPRMRLSGGRYASRMGARLSERGNASNIQRLRTPLAVTRAETQAIRAQEERVQSLRRAYNGVSGTVSRLGASMTTLGNTMSRVSSPFTNIIKGAAYTVGYGAINKLTSGLTSGFERYDIITTFPKRMQAMGFTKNVNEGREAIEKLRESVVGLPTSLTDMVSMQQRFAIASGDFKKSVDYAIAANNALLAGGADEQQRMYTMRQLADFMSAGKLQSTEWDSMFKSFPAGIRAIAQEMGYKSPKQMRKFREELRKNKISAKDFFKALKKAGTSGAIADAIETQKHTFGALASNINNVLSENVKSTIETLDGVLKKAGRGDVLDNLLGFRKAFNALGDSVRGWIKANPDKILNFMDKIQSFDWKGLARGFGEGISWVADGIGKLAGLFGGGDAQSLGRRIVKMNAIGTAISILGGAIKGLSPVIGGIARLGKGFIIGGGIAAVIGKLGGVVRVLGKLPSAAKAIRGAKTLSEVGKAMKGASISWQGVASQLVGAASIPMVAFAFKEAADALKVLDGVDMDWSSFGKKMKQMAVGIGAFLAMAAGVGAALVGLSSTPIGIAALGAGAAGTLTIDAVAMLMETTAKGLDAIAKAEIPDTDKINAVADAITESVIHLGEAGRDLPPDAITNAKKFAGIEGAMASIEAIGRTIPKIAALKLEKKDIDKATESIEAMRPAIDAMTGAIADLFGRRTVEKHETSNGRGKAGEHEVTYQKDFNMKALKEAAESTGLVQGMMDSIIAIAQGFQSFSKEMNKLKEMGDVNAIAEIGQNIGLMVDEIGHIAQRMNVAIKQFGDIEEAPAKFEMMNKTLQEFPKIIESVRKIGEASSGDNAIDIDAVFTPIIQGLTRAANSMNALLPQIETMRMLALNLQMAVDSIRTAFNGLNEIATIDVSGAINGITSAINQINGTQIDVSPLVNKLRIATNKIKAAWKNLMSAYDAIQSKSKSITISVSVDVSGAVSALNSAAAKLRAAWANLRSAQSGGGGGGGTVNPVVGAATGGYINGKGRPIYRAKGGGVWMEPKGTDTVPAMLTPGEYVQRKKAVDYFGVGFMQKINHLDLEGAIRSLSMRASRALSPSLTQSVTNHIDNRQNNARVNQTIYTSNQNFTFRKANRFVGAL